MKATHNISVTNDSGNRSRFTPLVKALTTLLTDYDVPSCRVEVLVTTNETMRQLNQEFRKIDEPTDVLTFPGPGWEGAPLGDIAISMEFAVAGASQRKVSTASELAALAVHGGLHLLGYDDVKESDRADMVALMNQILEKAGLPTDKDWSSQPHGGSA